MLGKFTRLFGKKPAIVKGTAKLENGQSKRVEFGDVLAGTGIEIVLCRIEGDVFAVDTACPHEGGRIVEGPMEQGRLVICPLHNYRFDPKTGEAHGITCRNAKTYKVVESGDQCEVYL